MILPQVLIGIPINFQGILKLYPPTVKDSLEFPAFEEISSLVTISQESIWDRINEEESGKKIYDFRLHSEGDNYKQSQDAPSPMDTLLEFCEQSPAAQRLVEEYFFLILREKVRLISKPNLIVLAEDLIEADDPGEARVISEDNYFDFQNKVRSILGKKLISKPDPDESSQVALIKAKARARDRIKSRQNSKDSISYSTTLLSLCCMNNGINPLNLGEIPYASVQAISRMNTQKDVYDSDIAIRSNAFAKVKGELKYWVRDFEE